MEESRGEKLVSELTVYFIHSIFHFEEHILYQKCVSGLIVSSHIRGDLMVVFYMSGRSH